MASRIDSAQVLPAVVSATSARLYVVALQGSYSSANKAAKTLLFECNARDSLVVGFYRNPDSLGNQPTAAGDDWRLPLVLQIQVALIQALPVARGKGRHEPGDPLCLTQGHALIRSRRFGCRFILGVLFDLLRPPVQPFRFAFLHHGFQNAVRALRFDYSLDLRRFAEFLPHAGDLLVGLDTDCYAR